MYTDEDLDNAVKSGIFTEKSVSLFRAHVSGQKNTHIADEENFRLIAGFNDIFVVIACALLLLSSGWVAYNLHPALSGVVISVISWVLAEFFVLKRKMALPAIALLITFAGGVFTAVLVMFDQPSANTVALAASLASVAVWFHWKRFKVPITVAAGAAAVITVAVSTLISLFPALEEQLTSLMFIAGISVFLIAMRWDTGDLTRTTRRSDVAFWLHLTAAPLIVHPVFSNLGVLEGNENPSRLIAIIILYILLTLISVVIDRRAFMVSSLVYVLVALTQLLKTYGLSSDSFAYVGVFVGFSLLLLSGFWHTTRSKIMAYLPGSILKRVPPVF